MSIANAIAVFMSDEGNTYVSVDLEHMRGVLLAGSELLDYFSRSAGDIARDNAWADLVRSSRVIKEDKSRSIVQCVLPGGNKVFCKIYSEEGVKAFLRRRLMGSRAEIGHHNTAEFIVQNHRTPDSQGYLEHIVGGRCVESIHFCDYLDDARTLAEVLDEPGITLDERRQWLCQTADMLSKLHGEGYIHGDVKLSNILCSAGHLYFVDLDGVCQQSGRRPPSRDVARLLVGLSEQSVGRDDRNFLFNYYCTLAVKEKKSFQFEVLQLTEKFQYRHEKKYGLKPVDIF